MKLTKREQILLIAALCIIMIVAFIMNVYLPLIKENHDLLQDASDLNIKIQKEITKQEQVKILKKQNSNLQERIDNESKNIMKVWDDAEIISFLEDTVSNLGIKESVVITTPIGYQNLQAGTITMNLKTNYYDLVKLIKKFENAKYSNTIASINITKEVQNISPKYTLNASLNIWLYTFGSNDNVSKD